MGRMGLSDKSFHTDDGYSLKCVHTAQNMNIGPNHRACPQSSFHRNMRYLLASCKGYKVQHGRFTRINGCHSSKSYHKCLHMRNYFVLLSDKAHISSVFRSGTAPKH